MAKNQFKFKLKITGFELEVEGSKEDVAAITSSVTNQIKGLTNPQILDDNIETEDVESTDVTPALLSPLPKKKITRKKSSSNVNVNQKGESIDFRNDTKKYSTPLMTWTTMQKALWILYVIKHEKKMEELSVSQIKNTFNQHFRQSKVIQSNNVSRDLGKVKLGSNALVGENTSVSPRTWYLTDAGNVYVENLIKEPKS